MEREYIVALAGNPNVGKSTIFNNLTGMHQHTGNWTGKTVANAKGEAFIKRSGDKNEGKTTGKNTGDYSDK